MEIYLTSTNPRPYFSSSTVKLPSWKNQHLVSISLNSRSAQRHSLCFVGHVLFFTRRIACRFNEVKREKFRFWRPEEHTVAASISIAAQATHYPLFIHFYGSSMDEVFDALAKCILPTSAIAANPKVIRAYCRFSWPYSQFKPPKVAIVIPMGGFHLYRSQLDAMENPEEAHARRGGELLCLTFIHVRNEIDDPSSDESAPWTFDPMLLLNCLKNLRNQGSVYAPSLDHGVGDPIEDDIFVSLQFIDVDLDTAMQRVLKRHISTGKPQMLLNVRLITMINPTQNL